MKKTKKTRLSSKRALEVLKFLVKKKFGAKEVHFTRRPFSVYTNCGPVTWCEVLVDVTYDDGKGFTSFIRVAYRGYGETILEIKLHTTWLQLLRRIEKQANCPSKKAFFRVNERNFFCPGDLIEKILIEMTLENGEI